MYSYITTSSAANKPQPSPGLKNTSYHLEAMNKVMNETQVKKSQPDKNTASIKYIYYVTKDDQKRRGGKSVYYGTNFFKSSEYLVAKYFKVYP